MLFHSFSFFFQEGDTSLPSPAHKCDELKGELCEWHEFQACQKILLNTPQVLFGYRIKVYRAEGTTQWYTAVIQSYDDNSKVRNFNDPMTPVGQVCWKIILHNAKTIEY